MRRILRIERKGGKGGGGGDFHLYLELSAPCQHLQSARNGYEGKRDPVRGEKRELLLFYS